MEFYLKELIDLYKASNCSKNNSYASIDFHGEILFFDKYNINKYSEAEQRQIIERFFCQAIDLIDDCSLFNVVLNHLYAGDYNCLSTNVKAYLFETLELFPPKQYLPWIYKILDSNEEMLKVNIQAFSAYIDVKRKRGLTNGEIRYTIICESSAKLLELILSKIYHDRLTSKQIWLTVFRLKQQLSMTTLQKDTFNEWLGIV